MSDDRLYFTGLVMFGAPILALLTCIGYTNYIDGVSDKYNIAFNNLFIKLNNHYKNDIVYLMCLILNKKPIKIEDYDMTSETGIDEYYTFVYNELFAKLNFSNQLTTINHMIDRI